MEEIEGGLGDHFAGAEPGDEFGDQVTRFRSRRDEAGTLALGEDVD